MSPDELEGWLKGDASTGSGWSKDDGSGETVGHERYQTHLTSSLFGFPVCCCSSTYKLTANIDLKWAQDRRDPPKEPDKRPRKI